MNHERATMADFAREMARHERFAFGENWRRFLDVLNEERIVAAEQSLREMLTLDNLHGRRFLDVGCGSGLFSLAAHRLGAESVHSLDYDPQGVACVSELRRRYAEGDGRWQIEHASILDRDYVQTLGQWDVVYSWGVLHHTGAMWNALAAVAPLVKPGGLLFISIYNDQGRRSRLWNRVKALYNRSRPGRLLVEATLVPYFVSRGALADLFRLRNPIRRYREYHSHRGMSLVHDWRDWLGGYPFEVAKPEEIFDFFTARGFLLRRMKTCGGGLGCNEFVFECRG